MSAAQRRKQRRLRSWWRHEQQSIAAALATFTHPLSPTGTEDGQGRGGGKRDEVHGQVSGRLLLPQPELFQLFEEEPGGLRPTGPQERVPRHTVEQMADVAPMVQILDAPVLQDGGPTGGRAQALRQLGARAGYRRAQGSHRTPSRSVRSSVSRSLRNSWWMCQLHCRRPSCSLPLMDTSGAGSWGALGCISGTSLGATPSGDPRRDTPPAQGGI